MSPAAAIARRRRGMSRRSVLRAGGAAGGGLRYSDRRAKHCSAGRSSHGSCGGRRLRPFAPGAFIRIDRTRAQ